MREDTYELCYNAACLLLGKGLYEEAEGRLKRAEGGCCVDGRWERSLERVERWSRRQADVHFRKAYSC